VKGETAVSSCGVFWAAKETTLRNIKNMATTRRTYRMPVGEMFPGQSRATPIAADFSHELTEAFHVYLG